MRGAFVAIALLAGLSVVPARAEYRWPSGVQIRAATNGVPVVVGSLTKQAAISGVGGGASLIAGQRIGLGAASASVQLSRALTVAQLARVARIAAGFAGPLVLAGLVYEGLQYINGQWQAVDSVQGGLCWNVSGPYASECTGWGTQICELPIGAVGHGYAYVPSPEWQNQVKPSLFSVQYLQGQPAPAGWVQFNNCTSRPNQGGYFPVALAKVGSPGYVPATDQQMEISFQQGLIAAPSKAADVLAASEPYVPADQWETGPAVATGPATVTGPGTTTTVQTDAGTETRTTTNTYNLTYSGDVVTVTQTTNTTTTYPDSTTKTETSTTTAPGGDVPPAEEKPTDVCVEHPDASGCEPLGEHDDEPDLQTEDRPFSWVPTMSAGGSCPAPKTATEHGRSLSLSWQPVCDLAVGVRPVVLVVAWIGAAVMVFGVGRKVA